MSTNETTATQGNEKPAKKSPSRKKAPASKTPAPDVKGSQHQTIGQAVLAVMVDVPYIQRKGAKGLNYTFLSEAELIAKIRPAMLEHGLTIRPTSVDIGHVETYPSSSGKLMNRVILVNAYELCHVASGETWGIASAGEGTDLGDKATPKAMTQAMKYAMREAFAIETGDDPDNTPSEQHAANLEAEGYRKILDAFTRATTKLQLLTLRDVYMNKRPNFSDEQRGALENVFWQRFDEAEGDQPKPPRNQQPPLNQ